ncbi:carbohydrate ABC transporter permease [Paenibacillus hamazuiensis]|uniref:carbohydrate ABC transporter permease n=1 Tax=Paenibacillus hamazuiensis TaxID=2936508 RepID=UPI00200C599D|nr:sugar ABC transporter permease [Paenibacillus hamazuiensis]
MKELSGKTHISGYLFVLPSIVTLMLLVTYPLLYGMYISFFNTNLLNQWDFVGFSHYGDIFGNLEFLQRIFVTLKFTVLTVGGHFVIGLGLAILLNRKLPGQTLFRAILILPWLLPEVVVGLLWKWLLNPMYGLTNHYLFKFNLISAPVSWLSNVDVAFWAVVVVCIWKGFPMLMLMVLAGLQTISEDLYEAAKIDGCTGVQSFRFITLPGLLPVLLVSLILDTVWWFKHFTVVWLLTQGGPANETNIVSIDIYKSAFEFFEFGKAAAMAVIVLFVCTLIGYVYRRMLNHDND